MLWKFVTSETWMLHRFHSQWLIKCLLLFLMQNNVGAPACCCYFLVCVHATSHKITCQPSPAQPNPTQLNPTSSICRGRHFNFVKSGQFSFFWITLSLICYDLWQFDKFVFGWMTSVLYARTINYVNML